MPTEHAQTTQYFNYRLTDDLSAISLAAQDGKARVVNCLNPHSFVTALDDADFRTALEESDYLLPDGEGICLTLKWWKGMRVAKVAGDDLHRYLLETLERRGGRVFYMGSRPEVLELIAKRIEREYPSTAVATLSPSYGATLSEDESRRIVEAINAFAPDVVMVGMTAPKQEKWVWTHVEQLKGVKVVANIGAVFDFFSGTVRRAPQWAIRMKLEWLVRLVKEPRRMWRRNFNSSPRFLRWTYRHRKEM